MKCYECSKKGRNTDAVALCMVCSMGLCMDHAIRENLPVIDSIDWGFGKEEHRYPVDIPRFLCGECKAAVDPEKEIEIAIDHGPVPVKRGRTLILE